MITNDPPTWIRGYAANMSYHNQDHMDLMVSYEEPGFAEIARRIPQETPGPHGIDKMASDAKCWFSCNRVTDESHFKYKY